MYTCCKLGQQRNNTVPLGGISAGQNVSFKSCNLAGNKPRDPVSAGQNVSFKLCKLSGKEPHVDQYTECNWGQHDVATDVKDFFPGQAIQITLWQT